MGGGVRRREGREEVKGGNDGRSRCGAERSRLNPRLQSRLGTGPHNVELELLLPLVRLRVGTPALSHERDERERGVEDCERLERAFTDGGGGGGRERVRRGAAEGEELTGVVSGGAGDGTVRSGGPDAEGGDGRGRKRGECGTGERLREKGKSGHVKKRRREQTNLKYAKRKMLVQRRQVNEQRHRVHRRVLLILDTKHLVKEEPDSHLKRLIRHSHLLFPPIRHQRLNLDSRERRRRSRRQKRLLDRFGMSSSPLEGVEDAQDGREGERVTEDGSERGGRGGGRGADELDCAGEGERRRRED